jgi:imidazolonepropionase-like amidohydrolase
MITRRLALPALLMLASCGAPPPRAATGGHRAGAVAETRSVRIHARRVLDGRGGTLGDVTLVIAGDRIVAIEPSSAPSAPPVDYDLSSLTVLPGLIDVHVHLDWHFNPAGRLHEPKDGETPEQTARAIAANARATLFSGFTTVQSPGDPGDAHLRASIARGETPGPRLLTSLAPLDEESGAPADLKRAVDQRKSEGADLIKIFASQSVRDGGGPTLSQEHLDAACGEAKAVGLRTLVHAHGAEAIRRATAAGCTQIEHGFFADAESLRGMAARGVYFDPQCGLVLQNYRENRTRYFGIDNFTEEGFAAMARARRDRELPARHRHARAEGRLRDRRRRGGTWTQRGGDDLPHRARGAEADGRRCLGDLARGGVAGARRAHRRGRDRNGGGPHRRRGRPAGGPHGVPPRGVRDEGGPCVPQAGRRSVGSFELSDVDAVPVRAFAGGADVYRQK